MATDLRDRLGDLAAHTPPGSPPADLWQRGVRRRRLARAGAAGMVVALVVLLGLGSWSWRLDHTRVEPVAPQGAPHLPDRFFWKVSPWLHPFAGPPGPLVQVFPTVRDTLLGQENALVGVTGSSGTYGLVTLPDGAVLTAAPPGSAFALTPDGRHLAFWVAGTPTGRPNTTVYDGTTIAGVGVYDTVTGHTRISRIPTAHGLQPSLLLWSDDSRLLLSWYQIVAGNGTENSTTSHYDTAAVWDVGSPRPVPVPDSVVPVYADSGNARATDGVGVAATGRKTFGLLHPAGDSHLRRFSTDQPSEVLVPSADASRVAGVVLGRHANTGPLVLGRLRTAHAPGARVPLQAVQGAGHDWFRVLAWIDDTHVAALRSILVRSPDGRYVAGEIDRVDLRTGARTRLVTGYAANNTNGSDPWLATDYLSAPVVHATPPPSPRNPRTGIVLGTVALVGMVVALVLLGRRFRGRRA